MSRRGKIRNMGIMNLHCQGKTYFRFPILIAWAIFPAAVLEFIRKYILY